MMKARGHNSHPDFSLFLLPSLFQPLNITARCPARICFHHEGRGVTIAYVLFGVQVRNLAVRHVRSWLGWPLVVQIRSFVPDPCATMSLSCV